MFASLSTSIVKLFSILLLCFAMNSCAISKVNPKAKNINDVYFFQNGNSYTVKNDEASLTLKREDFAIQFFIKAFHDGEDGNNIARIVAVPNQEEFDKLQVGVETEKTVNLERYSALAVSKDKGYNKQLFINDYGHHILYYKNDEDNTVDVIGKKGDDLLFQFEVASIFDKPNFTPIAESGLEMIYFGIYSDFNKNGIIDAGELTKVKLYLE